MLLRMKWVVGVDEAGRGPLAGPLAVGVVLVPADLDLRERYPGLNDSKKLSEKKREELFKLVQKDIKEGILQGAVMLSSARMIDEQGVSYAIQHALTRGVTKLLPDPKEGKVFLDGSLSAPKEYEQETIIGGDGIHPAIMLASVLAKVSRDARMHALDNEYPQFGFAKHKGYGTKAHIEAIRLYGTCVEHRQLFLRKIL